MNTILKTSDYSIFKYYGLNRKISTKHKNALIVSLSKINLLKYKPVIVDSNMYVVDGQHRIAAAQELKLEVYYVKLTPEISGEDAMVLFNQKQVEWKVVDFLKYHAGTKGGEYKELYEFLNEQNIPLAYAREFFSKKSLTSKEIREGEISFERDLKTEQIAEFINSAEVKAAKLTSSPFIRAIVQAHRIYSTRQMQKIKKKLIYLEPKATTKQYMTAFEKLVK